MIQYCSLVVILILSFSALSKCNDDEFAEFDDLSSKSPSDPVSDSSKQSTQRDHARDKNLYSSDAKNPSHPAETLSKERVKDDAHTTDKDSHVNQRLDDESTVKKPGLKLVDVPPLRIYPWESYYIEILFICASFLYLLNFFIGSSKNHSIASSWYENIRGSLKQQFTLVGGPPVFDENSKGFDEDAANAKATKKQRGLIKSTDSMYTLWCAGKQGVDGLLIEINLMKRQDLFSMGLGLMKNVRDTMVLRFLLNHDGYENFVFCIAQKSQATKLARDMIDINTFCSKRKPATQYGLDTPRLFVMSELSDTTSYIMDNETISFLNRFESSVDYIHITDQFSTARSEELTTAQRLASPKKMATFSFALPTNESERNEFLNFSLNLLDRLRRYKLARDSKQKSDKNRQKITEILQKTAFSQRQEAAQAKREEQRRIEREKIYKEDDPEKQKRWEQKEAKRENKRNKMRVKQLRVKSM